MNLKDLTVVIVTFKSDEIILNCLKSIPQEISVIVVENSNNHDFKKKIENNFKNINCILTGENKGYASANNVGLKLVKTKYALVLNPDALLDKNAIGNFLKTAETLKEFWLIGPGNDQMIDIDFKEDNLKEVDNLKGFAIFFNMSKFNDKYFDENFFLFFEEIDLCRRIKNSNGKIYLDKRILINHLGGSSVNNKNSFELEKNRNWHWMWSTFYYHKKYKGFVIAFILVFPKLLSAVIKTIIYLLLFKKENKEIYMCRLSGLFNSMMNKKSWYRPVVD
jgi:GT2 family glycosyltransferase